MRNYERLRDQDRRDAERMAYAISAPLHHTVGTTQCREPRDCKMCSNAARLAVQHYRRIIEVRMIEHIQREYDVRCNIPHPSSD